MTAIEIRNDALRAIRSEVVAYRDGRDRRYCAAQVSEIAHKAMDRLTVEPSGAERASAHDEIEGARDRALDEMLARVPVWLRAVLVLTVIASAIAWLMF